jgi:hypothetical protein
MHERLRSVSRLSDKQYLQQLSDILWSQKNEIGAKPITLPEVTSSFGLPILIASRQVVNSSIELGEVIRGYVLGLFEDRSELTVPSEENTEPTNSTWMSNHLSDFSAYKAPVAPLGWMVFEERAFRPDGFTCHTSKLIGRGKLIASTVLSSDPYFLSFSQLSDMNALTVGFDQTFLTRRYDALRKLSKETREMFIDYYSPDLARKREKDRKKTLSQPLHNQRGLATLLIDQAIEVSRKHGLHKLYLDECNINSRKLMRSYALKRAVSIEETKTNYHSDFVVSF